MKRYIIGVMIIYLIFTACTPNKIESTDLNEVTDNKFILYKEDVKEITDIYILLEPKGIHYSTNNKDIIEQVIDKLSKIEYETKFSGDLALEKKNNLGKGSDIMISLFNEKNQVMSLNYYSSESALTIGLDVYNCENKIQNELLKVVEIVSTSEIE